MKWDIFIHYRRCEFKNNHSLHSSHLELVADNLNQRESQPVGDQGLSNCCIPYLIRITALENCSQKAHHSKKKKSHFQPILMCRKLSCHETVHADVSQGEEEDPHSPGEQRMKLILYCLNSLSLFSQLYLLNQCISSVFKLFQVERYLGWYIMKNAENSAGPAIQKETTVMAPTLEKVEAL